MAILNYVEVTKPKKYPFEFQCDVCKSVFKLTSEYDILYNSDVENHMAVIKYKDLSGFIEVDNEIHCCSTNCLATAIKSVPFNAKITIPSGGFYAK